MTFYRYISEFLFWGFIILTVTGSMLAVRSRLLMHAVLGLAVSLLGVAGLYFYLGSMFLTLMQILIYVGAICVVLVFGIMVGHTPTEVVQIRFFGKNTIMAISASLMVFISFVVIVGKTIFVPQNARIETYSLKWLGHNLLYKYCLAFELISVVLLIAIVGAIILARGGRDA